MCRAPLPHAYRIKVKICIVTVAFYFCRGDINIDKHLSQYRNTYIIHNILAAHNLTGADAVGGGMSNIKPEDTSLDTSKIELDIALTHRLANRLGAGMNPVAGATEGSVWGDDTTVKELVLVNTDDIIESHYYPEYARPYIRQQPYDEEMEIESENLFKNVIMLIRLAIAYDTCGADCLK
jgi:hypothetical protein